MPRPVRHRLRSAYVIMAALCGAFAAEVPFAETLDESANPFKKYSRVAKEIYVSDRALFARHTGAPIPLRTDDTKYADVERKRIGLVTVAPGVRAYIDTVLHATGSEYEIRHSKDDKLIGTFFFDHAPVGPLLFTGQGVVYERVSLFPLCRGAVTRKYVLVGDVLQEVVQPMAFVNEETTVLSSIKLYSTPDGSGHQVATLLEGMTATVLTVQHERKFLLKTPLGLTGWYIEPGGVVALEVTNCN